MVKHKYYDFLNLVGYGLAKYDLEFVKEFGFANKSQFYEYFVGLGVVETIGVVKNRMDLFDPYFDNGRKGWWQKAEVYKHRKDFIDSLFGGLSVKDYADITKVALSELGLKQDFNLQMSPISVTKFKKLQETGLEAEQYFLTHYAKETIFYKGEIEDARLFGDGYDFQVSSQEAVYLAEVKGIRNNKGKIRLTEKEYQKALVYQEKFVLSVVLNLDVQPRLLLIENPIKELHFKEAIIHSKKRREYHLLDDIY